MKPEISDVAIFIESISLPSRFWTFQSLRAAPVGTRRWEATCCLAPKDPAVR